MTTAILLAAGTSSRMGEVNKLLLPINGMPLVKHMYNQISNAMVDHLIVVVGHEKEEVIQAVNSQEATFVINPNYKSGMTSSIKAGIRAIDWPCDAVMICLCDQPLLTTKAYNFLLAQSQVLDAPFIQVPRFEMQNGNPLIFSQQFLPELLQHSEPNGCKGVVQRNKSYVRNLNFSGMAILKDMDTPDAFDHLKKLM